MTCVERADNPNCGRQSLCTRLRAFGCWSWAPRQPTDKQTARNSVIPQTAPMRREFLETCSQGIEETQ